MTMDLTTVDGAVMGVTDSASMTMIEAEQERQRQLAIAASQAILNRYKLAPAPAKINRIVPVDMGKYVEGYDGWIVLFDVDADLSVYELLARAEDSTSSTEQLALLKEWGAKVAKGWNFTRTVEDENGQPTTELMPQPSDGGMSFLAQALLQAFAEAYQAAVSPPKDSKSK